MVTALHAESETAKTAFREGEFEASALGIRRDPCGGRLWSPREIIFPLHPVPYIVRHIPCNYHPRRRQLNAILANQRYSGKSWVACACETPKHECGDGGGLGETFFEGSRLQMEPNIYRPHAAQRLRVLLMPRGCWLLRGISLDHDDPQNFSRRSIGSPRT